MIAASAMLFLIGLADVLYRHTPPTTHLWWREAILGVVALALTLVSFVSAPWWGAAGVLLGFSLWLLTYFRWRALAMIGTAMVLSALLAPVGFARSLGEPHLFIPTGEHWLVTMWVLLIGGCVLINLVTANRVVRAVLAFSEREPVVEVGQPRAGRVIGVLERYLLIALVLGGQALSMAGLAAAKSIIRYPEISSASEEKPGLSAEVFFIGTVTSWLVAIGSAALLLLAAP